VGGRFTLHLAYMSDFLATFQNQPVLITGGLGFIGSNLARRLADLGAVVTVIDSLIPEYGGKQFNLADYADRVRVNIADVRDEHSMNYLVREQAYLFNLAGQVSHLDSMHNPYVDLDINCRSQLSILEACRKHNPTIRIVFSGTRQIYGKPHYLPVDERHPIDPVDVNGVNKVAGEWYHLVYQKAYGLKTTSLRLTNTYGPRMRVIDARQTFLGVWLRKLIEGQELLVYGDGEQKRDLNYVDDVVDALLLAAIHPEAVGQIFNLGGDEVVSLNELAALMVEINGGGQWRRVPFPAEQKAIDIGDYCGDYGLIQYKLGWRPRTPLREGLARTLAYYRAHHAEYW
jgi:UDP-glucose 4-epimerase